MTSTHAIDTSPARAAGPDEPAFDDDGFLLEPESWSRTLAQQLAAQAGVGRLGAQHWTVIDLVRSRYLALGALPVMRLVCRAAGLDPRQGQALFSSCATLWRIAGLPHPGGEALAYMH
ncbi:MAG: TusE/DsrC/DsvC family sulfur relay protein [Burkholderiales bacterium]|nr:TusE/DsrC/DsvC family sulfur relay protein [Burkholderiales bacterium]